MTTQPDRIALDDLTSDALDALYDERDAARATARRLNYRAQQAESKNAAFERAVSQWDVNERGTYIPHTSLRAIGIAAGTDILGSVRHLKHFQRVEQAEARVRALEAEVTRLTAGQCTHALAACEQHHTTPVAGCPYPRCRAATDRDQRAATAPGTPA
ncbi:hypothetical protein [Streptomyces sp. SID2119]|uniref:hypothetical protein n=1 Tax=Streptomyces sp. SID2119 TaxID=2690253 RepID=UPI00136C97B1|nr:hypothetical protein [Streptomyces sp. SID2119]MYW33591.1 hypothetical protein [Streptomyces sp. SID2119]